ncbi:hypothetical protein BO82DRAFT_176137 [Aspergillus uvarum CBS 121591]|uniref:C2H2-type domain-containing protein n=1 Tax=Aspergillus uvarum CBS 121591 TaxID=1448315 RepID=A0A319C036_9EURO|nr:hypothetical protein BO82DRAFT_176137 [Aspergillus uvarum CBS 121591]PYH77707.1 hypothetical protein BO82DRAFT_176137 [Aspergillus uvarum CBS 121591]
MECLPVSQPVSQSPAHSPDPTARQPSCVDGACSCATCTLVDLVNLVAELPRTPLSVVVVFFLCCCAAVAAAAAPLFIRLSFCLRRCVSVCRSVCWSLFPQGSPSPVHQRDHTHFKTSNLIHQHTTTSVVILVSHFYSILLNASQSP